MLANWGSSETSTEGGKKQAVNFSGTLTTQQGETYKIDNIAIGRRYEQIPLYKDTTKQIRSEPISGDTTDADQNKFTLKEDPQEGIIAKIDLSETAAIQVNNPDALYTYQKRKGSRKTDYLEVVVISNGTSRTKNNYLVDTRRKITCDQLDEAGPIELEVPFATIKQLTIEDCRSREAEKKCGKKKKTVVKKLSS
jgi:hypothetical protein